MNTSSLVLEQYVDVLNRNIPDIDRNVYETQPPEYQYFCNVTSTTRQVDQFLQIQGLARPTRNRDEEPLPQVAPTKGYASTIRQTPYRSAIVIGKSTMQYADHDVLLNNMQDMIEAEKSLRDAVAADMLNNGTSAQAATDFTEADGTQRALFSTTHYYEDNSATFSNYYNVGVPPNTDTLYLVLAQYLGRLKDFAGNYIGIARKFTILTPTLNPDFVKAADNIIMSNDNPETANRAVNTVTRRFQLSHQPVNNLTSSTAWYVSIGADSKGYPIQMRVGSDREISPLSPYGAANPDLYISRLRSHFGVGLRYSARGIVRIGT